jgi:hypothetical protein
MYKSICVVAVLLAAFAFVSGSKPASASPNTPVGPEIVVRLNLTNQNSTIPQTIIFTPTHTGLYRVSPYMASTVSSGSCCWYLDFFWTDEGGTRSAGSMMTLGVGGTGSGAGYGLDWSASGVFGSFPFRAVAGQPVSYDISGGGAEAGPYELTLVIERLE